jgi:hypothetical protein
MLKPLLPPEVWEAFVRESMTLPHPLQDPEQVDIWTSEEQTRLALRRSPLRPMPLVALAHGRPTPAPPGWPVEEDERLWRQLQHELAQLVPGRPAGDRYRERPRHLAGATGAGAGRHRGRGAGRARR